mgnify:CR=1 FL=1
MLKEIEIVRESPMPGLSICHGITHPQALELIAQAHQDPLVAQNTSDPKRFRDAEALSLWLAKGRTIYTLTGETERLLGIIWLGDEPLPIQPFTTPIDQTDYDVTLAMRIYAEARGRGLAKAFLVPTLVDYLQNMGVMKKGIWIGTSVDNAPVIKSFGKLGFQQVTNPDSKQKIVMVASRENILHHVLLPSAE